MKEQKDPLVHLAEDYVAKPAILMVAAAVGVVFCFFGLIIFFLGHPTLGIFALVIGALAIAFAAWLFYK